MLLPFSSEIGDTKSLLKGIIEILEKGTKLKEVTLSTNKKKELELGTRILNEFIGQFIDDNEICIDY